MNILIEGAKTSAAHSAVRRTKMDAAAVRLRQNSLQSVLGDLKDVVVVLEVQGSLAALLDEPNRPAFDALTAGTDDGAVTANLRAAAAMEDQTGLEPVETFVGGPQPLRRWRAILRSLGHNVNGPVEPVKELTPSAWPAAQVADWLCCDIPSDEEPSMLPSVAAAVQKVHAVASGAAASSV
ncbi:hypothetical protein I4F81_008716 [Pyropia yezoensis]|uniref:Uncharacterized protein n=1 Tax=Pyropia yezoensis TaxID=2788 RepID=A0ACC3C8Y0_PYRYE|nr:hypothetical protein I4F81_008716 [Neopyropia yezoensis]